MDGDQFSALLASIVPCVVGLVASRQGLDEPEAARRFFLSRLYEKRSGERLKIWHYSPETLYALYAEECEKGSITFPEEAG